MQYASQREHRESRTSPLRECTEAEDQNGKEEKSPITEVHPRHPPYSIQIQLADTRRTVQSARSYGLGESVKGPNFRKKHRFDYFKKSMVRNQPFSQRGVAHPSRRANTPKPIKHSTNTAVALGPSAGSAASAQISVCIGFQVSGQLSAVSATPSPSMSSCRERQG